MKLKFVSGVLVGVFFSMSIALADTSGSQVSKPKPVSPPTYSLDSDERWILDRGEIGDGAYIGGGVAGTLLGLGIGHAIQGRYSRKGWIFTVGELATYGIAVAGAVDCLTDALGDKSCSTGTIVFGVVGYIGFRIWEIIDVWAGPPEHNRAYRSLKARGHGESLSFFVLPLPTHAMAGVQYRF